MDSTLTQPRSAGTRIHLVVGPAGIGKTVLFEAVFARLYDWFLRKERHTVRVYRPLPLTVDYLEVAASHTLRSLLQKCLNTEFVRLLGTSVLEWMVLHGGAMLLLDGLEEAPLEIHNR